VTVVEDMRWPHCLIARCRRHYAQT